ncbi:hypothetical protein GCM10020367_68200 [Streptomyces sannanensis]|uniref:ABC transporter ATP-binding protein n=1 Tax=Streptomyces sannanensis TaxID=285536 RepID=A0ABP6SN32_9ACTN
MESLRRRIAGRTTIVVSHNLFTARDATCIVVLDHGRIVKRGTHEELFRRGGTHPDPPAERSDRPRSRRYPRPWGKVLS